MKQSNSFFSISPALIKNCMKQHWIIPVLMFITYFVTGILPTIMSYSNFENIADYTIECLCNYSIFFSAINFIIPICTAVAVFHYIHSSNSVTALYSMPFSRNRLFNSALVSGWIMMIIPVIATGLLFMALTGAHPTPTASAYSPDIINAFTIGKCFLWIVDTAIIISFVYAISVFAGIIAGTNLIHALLSVFLNVVLFLLFYIVQNFLLEFLFGYAEKAIYSYFSPLTYSYLIKDGLGSGNAVIELVYVAVSIILIIVASILHNRIKLEREGDATVFGIAGEILTFLVTFVGMTIFSMLIKGLISSEKNMGIFFAGAFIGSVLFFAISRMIIEKTAMIINKRNAVRFAVFLIISAVFFSFTVFDISGYQKRIPDSDNVESVEIDMGFDDNTVILKDKSDIDTIVQYHKTVADYGYSNGNLNYRTADSNESNNEIYYDISLSYKLKNGRRLNREFHYYAPENSNVTKAFEKVYSLTAYQNQNVLFSITEDRILGVSITSTYSGDFTEIEASHRSGFLTAIRSDLRKMKYTDLRPDSTSKIGGEISLTYKTDTNETEDYVFELSSKATNTIDFLKKNGYSEYIND